MIDIQAAVQAATCTGLVFIVVDTAVDTVKQLLEEELVCPRLEALKEEDKRDETS